MPVTAMRVPGEPTALTPFEMRQFVWNRNADDDMDVSDDHDEYLEWLEERYNIGRRRDDGERREFLIKDPFIRKTRHTRFQPGCNIPKPAGQSWLDKLKEKDIGSDLKNEEHMNCFIAESYCNMMQPFSCIILMRQPAMRQALGIDC